MPNWTTCDLKAPADVLKKYLTKDDEGKYKFDFNLLIPQPEIYDDPELTDGSDTDSCIYWYLSTKGKVSVDVVMREFPKLFSLPQFIYEPKPEDSDSYYRRGEKYMKAYLEYGHKTWYSWSNANWGTKWNACNTSISAYGKFVSFDTPWCMPEPVIMKLFEDNPGCEISFYWVNEDYDGNHWMIRHADGTLEEGCDFDENRYEED